MVIFYSYVSLPEGTQEKSSEFYVSPAQQTEPGKAERRRCQRASPPGRTAGRDCPPWDLRTKEEDLHWVKPLWIYQGLLLDIPCVYRIYIQIISNIVSSLYGISEYIIDDLVAICEIMI